jgi:hypothetical protein
MSDEYMDYWQSAGYTGGGGEVVPDNAYGAPAMTTWTPTGNGTGQYVTPGLGNWLGNTLDKALNYAIIRDQMQMAQVSSAPIRAVQTQAAQARATDSRVLFYLLLAAAAIYVVKS